MSDRLYARIALENTAYSFDRLFAYAVPEELSEAISPGKRVLVPFGAGNRMRVGMVFSLSPDLRLDGGELKEVSSILDREPMLSSEMLSLCEWVSERYFCTLFEAVRLMLPVGLRLKVKSGYIIGEDREQEADFSDEQRRILSFIKGYGKVLTSRQISDKLGITEENADFEDLLKRGAIKKVNLALRRVGDARIRMVRPVPDFEGKLTPRQRDVYDTLMDAGEVSEKELCYFTGSSLSVVNALKKNGAAEIYEYEVYRRPETSVYDGGEDLTLLSDSQREVYESLLAECRDPGKPRTALLYGVTGSGKTSIYMKLIDEVCKEGRGAIVMVPEISLTPQAVSRFERMFGEEIAVFHSGLSLGERADEYKRVLNGDAKIVLGTRSAVFAPVKNLGLIVIDEEQESTYKSESSPRYDAREVARRRCAANNAFCLLSSATPSVESYRAAKEGRFGFHVLKERYGPAVMPDVMLVDMNAEGVTEDGMGISQSLGKALADTFNAGKQSIVLINRRGYNPFATCTSCHEVLRCPNCSISLTYHRDNGRLMCHYCGYSIPFSKTCPNCGEDTVSFRGMGTQRVEEELGELLPNARILRLDTDAVATRYSLEKKLGAFSRGEYDVLVGTQMVAKGLNFENVTLVGVLSADQSLFSDDFRAAERTFDLLDQVVGRAGRGKFSGKAIIQTYFPENPVINFAACQNYPGFYEQEIMYRQALLYPPFSDLLMLGFSGDNEDLVREASETFFSEFETMAKEEYPDLPIRALSPSPASIAKVGGKYRYKIIIKHRNSSRFREMISRLLKKFPSYRRYRDITAFAAPNPYRIL